MIAGITFSQILLILVIFGIMNIVLLTPVILCFVKTFLEYNENQEIRRRRGSA